MVHSIYVIATITMEKKNKLFLYSTNVVCVNRKIDRNKCPASLCGTVSVCLCDSVRERERVMTSRPQATGRF